MRAYFIAAALLTLVAPAMGDYYVAGDFNGWDPAGNIMTETAPGSGVWTVDLTGFLPGERHEFKTTNGTWNVNWPSTGNSWFVADGDGNITITYDTNTYTDGWVNSTKRLGVSSAPETWTAVGDWQGWDNANPATAMTPLGGGIYYLQTVIPARSEPYQYKAVVTGSWDAIGQDARSINAQTVQFNVTAGHTQWGFWVNTLNGTVKARSLPESPVNVDGLAIPTDFDGLLRATQANATGFGDNTGPPTGSELDALYVARGTNEGSDEVSRDGLFIGITGNLETNGNSYVILLDTQPGTGTNVISALAGPGALTGLNGTVLDPGFSPKWAITVNNRDGTTYVDVTNLATNVNYYFGHSAMDSGNGVLTGGFDYNNTMLSFNNRNHAGITSDPDALGDPTTATKGLEMHIPFEDLQIYDPGSLTNVGVMVILDVDGGVDGAVMSNQTLAGLGGGYMAADIPRGGSSLDFSIFPGDQYALVPVTTPIAGPITIDGDDIPTDLFGYLVALQNNHTDWGDKTNELGSELDQLFVGQDADALLIGLTGNLLTNGNFWLVFLQGGPGGMNVLDVPEGVGPESQVLQGLNGTTFDAGFAPTHVLCMNTYGGTCHVDLVDLRNGTSRYLGSSGVDSGTGVLGADNPLGAQVAFNNTNVLGVTDVSAAGAATATTGAEIYLPLGCIGGASCAGSVGLMAWLVSNTGDVASNQTLPPLPAPTSNPALPVDFTAFAGDQFIALPITGSTFGAVASVAEAKAQPNGTPVHLQARVSAALSNGVFYVQDQGMPAGLAVIWLPPAPDAGSLVDIDGYLCTAPGYGMRALEACAVTVVEPPSGTFIKPLGMSATALGGAPTANDPGVDGASGANNVGSLVRIWGVVTDNFTVPNAFYIDDGNGLKDGTELDGWIVTGVRVLFGPDQVPPLLSAYVAVTGISTYWVEYPEGAPRVNHRAVQMIGDVTYY